MENLAQPKRKQDKLSATPVGNLLNRHGISLPRLMDLLHKSDFKTSQPMLSRFVNQKLSSDYMSRFSKAVAQVLPPFLIACGLPKSQVDAEMQEVFNEGEYKPMISKRIALTDAECEFYGFYATIDGKRTLLDPFKNDPASREEVYFPAAYREIYDRVIDAIKYRHFVAVLGPIGSGKTTLRRLVEDALDTDDNLQVVWPEFFDQSKVSAYEIARSILRHFDAKVPGRATALGKAVTDKLRALTNNGKRVAIAFDEAHKMERNTLRSLKNFHEMSSGGFQKYLGIFLFGWPSFESMLTEPAFQEIYERINVMHMPEFAGPIAKGYIQHRFRILGLDVNTYFDGEALDYICQNADTPLQLGNIANNALRITKDKFEETRVIGTAIKQEMFLDNGRREPAFNKR